MSGKTAVVTGASRAAGIGAAVARHLAAAGANLFITTYAPYDAAMPWGSEPDAAAALLEELRGAGVQAAGMEIDLSRPEAPVALFDRVETTVGPAHILVNNAAYSVDAGLNELTADLLDRHHAVNVRGMALLCTEFVRRLPAGCGRIINLTSGQGLAPMPGNLAYAASKGAVDAFTTSLAAELAPRAITVNAVDPGPTDTGWMPDDLREKLAAASPRGRVGAPDDAARLVRFLASPAAGWITGQIIRSRGGF